MKTYNIYFCLVLTIFLQVFTSCDENAPERLDLSSNLFTGNEPPPDDCEIGHRTQTPGGWGAPAAGNNPGTIRDAYFDEVFPDGLVIGCNGGFKMKLTSAEAVENFLPSGGKPKPIDQFYIDPTNKQLKNTLASHLVALTLSIHIDHYWEDFGEAEFLLCDLQLCSGEFAGVKVQPILQQANSVLGGCPSVLTVEEAIDLVSQINENFVDGETDNGFLCCQQVHEHNEDNATI